MAAARVSAASAGVITTPGVACLVKQKKFAAGIVVSASHNPYHDNGIKLFAASGMKFPDETEEQLEAEIMSGEIQPAEALWLDADPALDAEYLEFLRKLVLPGSSFKGMKIVLDCANGAAFRLGPELFHSLGVNVAAINVTPDGKNINTDCGSLHPGKIAAARGYGKSRRWALRSTATPNRALFVSANGKTCGRRWNFAGRWRRYLKSIGQAEERSR